MSTLSMSRIAVVLIVVGCLLVGNSQAQVAEQSLRQGGRGNTPMRQNAENQNQEVDQFLAACLLAKNRAEIELSQLAEQQAQNPQVKQFAQQMVQEHQQLSQKLEPLATTQFGASSQGGQRHSVRYGSQADQQRSAQTDTRRSGALQPGTTRDRTRERTESHMGSMHGQMGGSQSRALGELREIDQQITQRASQAICDELKQKSDEEFDQAYLGCQIGAHTQMKAALEVIEQQTSGQLQQIAQQTQPSVEQHLQQAEKLMKQVGQSRPNRAQD
jgi:predicted outer membrane protein